jgi:hypothetical protein
MFAKKNDTVVEKELYLKKLILAYEKKITRLHGEFVKEVSRVVKANDAIKLDKLRKQ